MPAPYALLPIPAGNYKDLFESQAMTMTLVHNTFIRGINSIYFHAPHIQPLQVKPFVFYCLALLDGIHHHHAMEEELYFPEIEKRLGLETMDANVDQHKLFLPQLTAVEEFLKDIESGRIPYDSTSLLEKLDTFTDMLMAHLREEIPTLEPNRLRAHMSVKDLEEIEAAIQKRLVETYSFSDTLPLLLITHDRSTAPWFPPLPAVVMLLVQYVFSWKHSAAWKFGPCDIYMRLKDRKTPTKA